MRAGHLVYWFITGALLGLGLVELTGLGLVLFPAGLVLLAIGLVMLRGREMVAGVVGFGALPETAFVSVLVTVNQFQFPTPFYSVGTLVFGVITLVGVVALMVVWRVKPRATGPAKT
jgi:hypothetical protein